MRGCSATGSARTCAWRRNQSAAAPELEDLAGERVAPRVSFRAALRFASRSRIGVALLARNDEGDGHLRHPLVGVGDDRRRAHRRVLEEELLHLHRVHVLAADLDHVLAAAKEAQVPVFAQISEIAASQPPLGVDRGRRLHGFPVVALHQVVAPDQDLARRPGRQLLAGFRVRDADLEPVAGVPGRFAALLLARVEEGGADVGAALGRAIGGQGLHRGEDLAHAPHDRDRARHAARKEADSKARRVARPPFLGVHERLEVAVEALHLGCPLRLDEPDALVRIEARGEDLPAARHDGKERPVHVAEYVEEREVVQHHVRFGDREPLHAVALVAKEVVIAHHPLGEARGAGREHDEEGVVHRHRGGPRREVGVAHRAPGFDEGGVRGSSRVLPIGDGDDPFEEGKAFASKRSGSAAGSALRYQLAHHGEIVDGSRDVVGDEGRAIALAHHVLDVVGAKSRVGGYQDRSDPGDREEEVDPLGAVVEPEADLVAGGDAKRDEPFRRLVDPARNFREGLARRAEDERFPVAPPRGRARGKLPDRGPAVPVPAVTFGQHVRCVRAHLFGLSSHPFSASPFGPHGRVPGRTRFSAAPGGLQSPCNQRGTDILL